MEPSDEPISHKPLITTYIFTKKTTTHFYWNLTISLSNCIIFVPANSLGSSSVTLGTLANIENSNLLIYGGLQYNRLQTAKNKEVNP